MNNAFIIHVLKGKNMCFHNSMSVNARRLAERYGRKSDVLEIAREIIEEKRRNGEIDDIALEEYRSSAYPIKITTENETYYQYKKYPIITEDEQIRVMEWGLIPFWINTTEGNSLTNKIHNGKNNPFRMPLILSLEQESLWLNSSMEMEKDISIFLKTFPETNMNAYPVNKEHFLHSDIHNRKIIEEDKGVPNVLHSNTLF